ncbi:MAG: metallophosphoesterase [Actinobacteria bacterium]|nr:metallophosphoesterase [Actinomycetota bacterium]
MIGRVDVTALRRRSKELGFTPQDQVRWLSPVELARTAVTAGLGSLFADYTDRRETQAALPATPLSVPADPDGGVWWDYMADTGDGFDPTYTMVSLLAAPRVDVLPPDGVPAGGAAALPVSLPRGRALVLGGDEVYPVSSTSNYEDRLKSLMRAAWEPGALAPGEREPAVYALPGNHDWYDGLTAFLRVFAQRRMVGGWRSEQTRSYFAVRLPAKWWLVGVDTQLGTYLDGPQLEYFRRNLSAHLEPGDAVVVCAPTPTWVHTAEDDPDAFNSLHFFEREVVRCHTDDDGQTRPTGASVRLWLTGDRHHYARYAEQTEDLTPRQLVTCGLGGAYLAETHRLPEQLVLPAPGSKMASPDEPAAFDLAARWPDAARSRRLVRGLLGGPPHGLAFRNPGLWRLLGSVHAVALLLQAFVLGLVQRSNPVLVLRNASPRDALDLGWQTAVWLAVAVAVAVLLPLLRGRAPRRPGEVLLAVVLQLAVSSASFAAVLAVPWPAGWPDWVVLGVAFGGTVLVTGLVACEALAAYILVARNHTVASWQMSAQSVEDYKGFLRIRVDADGRLTMYPLAVTTVCRDWDVVAVDGAATHQPGVHARPVPAGGLPAVRLVEPPVVVER